ncbi:hypothetical protein L1049_021166 [Liquidambar formosana]|uniref:ascorbate ferrireductase (transmembrane) n=1 Tax=Liquidambar formosana TaxID=63359 RepID=A0AAP0SDQ2_LIQFO
MVIDITVKRWLGKWEGENHGYRYYCEKIYNEIHASISGTPAIIVPKTSPFSLIGVLGKALVIKDKNLLNIFRGQELSGLKGYMHIGIVQLKVGICINDAGSVVLHPVLMLIGLIIIGGEAIISYKSLPLRKEVKKLIHLVLHAIALILGIIGVYAAFKYHNESSIVNLYSLHSWLGIGVIVLYGIQWIFGFLLFFFPGGSPTLRANVVPWHVLFGLFVYVMALATASLGFLEKLTFLENSGLAKYGSEAFLVNFTAIVTVLYGVFVVVSVLSQAPAEDDYSYSSI